LEQNLPYVQEVGRLYGFFLQPRTTTNQLPCGLVALPDANH